MALAAVPSLKSEQRFAFHSNILACLASQTNIDSSEFDSVTRGKVDVDLGVTLELARDRFFAGSSMIHEGRVLPSYVVSRKGCLKSILRD